MSRRPLGFSTQPTNWILSERQEGEGASKCTDSFLYLLYSTLFE